jgi:hypothetical protein
MRTFQLSSISYIQLFQVNHHSFCIGIDARISECWPRLILRTRQCFWLYSVYGSNTGV